VIRLRRRIRAWPTTIKVPVMVAALMVAVSVVLSNQVLVRLTETQQRHLQELTGAYLDGLSTSVVPLVQHDDIWEIFDQLDRTRHGYVGVRAVNTIVAAPNGTILAASDPRLFPTQQHIPVALESRFQNGAELALEVSAGRAFMRRALSYQGRPVGWIYAEIDIGHMLAERREVLVALVFTNVVLTLLFAGCGYLAVRRMIRPIGILADHLDSGRGGQIEAIPDAKIGSRDSEFGRLFHRYNAMVEALNQREALAARLAKEEQMASLGRLASGMAHEINNPLGGMFNAIDTMERHDTNPAVRRTSLEILKRGLVGIRDVVRATLVTYKSGNSDRKLCPSDLDDLRFLVRQEVARRNLGLTWRNELPDSLDLPAGPIRQAVLNLLLNACAASPMQGQVEFRASVANDALFILVRDHGPGIAPDVAAMLESDGADGAPPLEGRGLGAWMVSRLMAELGGQVRATTAEPGGTRIEISVPIVKEGALRDVA
jgi:signal transduction histidine kinase